MTSPDQKIFTTEVMNIMARSLMTQMQVFSRWLIVAFGAAVALMVTNVNDLAQHIDPSVIAQIIRIFLAAVLFNVIQRYMAMIKLLGITVSKKVEIYANGHDLSSFDMETFKKDVVNTGVGPLRTYLKWSFKKTPPDPFNQAKNAVRNAQFQGFLLMLQIFLLCWAGYTVASSLT